MTTDGGSSPALDRLRAEINDKLSVAFFTAGHTSKVHQQIVLKQCEDYLVELFQTTVRELVPVPPAPQPDELERVGLALGTNGQFHGLLAGGTAYPHANAVLNVLAERDNLRKRLGVVPPALDQDVETFNSVRQSITNAQTHISSEPPDLHGAMYSLQRALSTLRQKV